MPRLRVQCLCFLCLHGPPSPGQMVQTMRHVQVNNLHPRLHHPLNCASPKAASELIHVQPEHGNLTKQQTSLTTWTCPCCTHQPDCELRHRGREAVACSRAEPRGTLQLSEHEAGSCSPACTNIAMCYLLLRLNFKTIV